MTRLILLDEYPPGFAPEPGDHVVSLTAQASYWLDRAGQPYAIAPDAGTEQALRQREERYWQEQLAWFDDIDVHLQERLEALRARNIRPTMLYGHYWKIMLDQLFVRGLESSLVLNQRSYDRVVLWTRPQPPGGLDQFVLPMKRHGLRGGVWSRVWPVLCAARGIPFEEQIAPNEPAVNGNHGPAQARHERSREWAWRMLGWLSSLRPSAGSPLVLLFLETNRDLRGLLRHALSEGHRCLLSRGQRVIDLSHGGRCLLTLHEVEEGAASLRARWHAAAQELCAPASPLWRWPDSWFGVPMRPLLADHLTSWMASELYPMISLADQFHALYAQAGVDFVVTSCVNHRTLSAAVAACHRPNSRARSVLMAHGDGPDEAPAWDLIELFPYQHYVVPHVEFADYFRARRALYPGRAVAQVHVGSYRWPRLAGLRRDEAGLGLRRPPMKLSSARPVVVYVVGRPEDAFRYLNKPDYSETAYYRLETALLRLFARRSDYTFVIQLFPGAATRPTAVERFVHDLGASHLSISRAPFTQWLSWADRVIMDTPSTPLYETALAGVPFRLLVPRGWALRPTAVSQFAASLSRFTAPEEAVAIVDQYLDQPVSHRPLAAPAQADLLQTFAALRDEASVTP
ncbi:MAG: hypothetical protein HY737_01035 [Candidatus Omnitrophica bacterium]|nr:hypothetical protein [Candidatus Omnitrophota bacterium]